MVLLVGPTAAGRNTLINILSGTGRYHYIPSDTTRPPRVNNGIMEQNGREYWFKTEDDVLEGLQAGEYIEAALIHRQQVSGVNIHGLKLASTTGKIAITEIEPAGGAAYYAMKPNGLFIFLLPPNFDIWMQRLRGRGDMPEDELRRRLESARGEITTALTSDFYQFVINNEIHEAAMAVDELANGRAPDAEKQRLGRDHAEQLAIDVQLYLAA
jgi:guanylate kinase